MVHSNMVKMINFRYIDDIMLATINDVGDTIKFRIKIVTKTSDIDDKLTLIMIKPSAVWSSL